MSEIQGYTKVSKGECWQERTGRTPCFELLASRGVECGMQCPIELACEKDERVAQRKLHFGICFMDLSRDGVMALVEATRVDDGKRYVLTPNGPEEIET